MNKLAGIAVCALFLAGCQASDKSATNEVASPTTAVAPATTAPSTQPEASPGGTVETSLEASVAANPGDSAGVDAGASPGANPAASGGANNGEVLAKANGCMACHQVDKKLVGPGYREVAVKYQGDPAAEAKLMKKIKDGGSGVWGPVPMPPHPALSDADLKTMADWILSLR